MGTICRKNVSKEENFRKNFSTVCREKFSSVAKTAFYVSIGDSSRNTFFPKRKNFLIQQKLLGLYSLFFRRICQNWFLRAHRNNLGFPPRPLLSSHQFWDWAKIFWATLPQKIGDGCQNFNLRSINILNEKTFFRKRWKFFLFSNFHKKNWSLVENVLARLSKLHSTGQVALFKAKLYWWRKNFLSILDNEQFFEPFREIFLMGFSELQCLPP